VAPIERDGVSQIQTCASVARPRWCLTLLTCVLWRSWMAVCPDFTLQTMMRCSGCKSWKVKPHTEEEEGTRANYVRPFAGLRELFSFNSVPT